MTFSRVSSAQTSYWHWIPWTGCNYLLHCFCLSSSNSHVAKTLMRLIRAAIMEDDSKAMKCKATSTAKGFAEGADNISRVDGQWSWNAKSERPCNFKKSQDQSEDYCLLFPLHMFLAHASWSMTLFGRTYMTLGGGSAKRDGSYGALAYKAGTSKNSLGANPIIWMHWTIYPYPLPRNLRRQHATWSPESHNNIVNLFCFGRAFARLFPPYWVTKERLRDWCGGHWQGSNRTKCGTILRM